MRSKNFIAVAISIVLLSIGWLGLTGLTLLAALVPLLWISHKAEDSRRGWWSVFGYALLAFVGWNLSTIWWIGLSTPIGPVAATLASSLYSITAFMIYHTISKRAPKTLAYTALVSIWIAFEYNYTVSEFSWPWLLMGNGFSNDIWAIQWYEFTGIFGGSLWVMVTNVLIFESLISTKRGVARWLPSAVAVALPLLVSTYIYNSYELSQEAGTMEVTVIQPNVNCYEREIYTDEVQERNILGLLGIVPASTDLVLLPETSAPRRYTETQLPAAPFIRNMVREVESKAPQATLVSGVFTIKWYEDDEPLSKTARRATNGKHYDLHNSAVALNSSKGSRNVEVQQRDKSRLVIGVENTPTWIFKIFKFLVIDIGDIVGQIGIGEPGNPFSIGDDGILVGSGICYEGLYGDNMAQFVRDGAELITIISNDCWWGDTPGHRHLYSLSQVRAVELRRDIARSANTGISGFINSRGDNVKSMEWMERGAMTHEVTLSRKMTIYAIYGDYIARIACFVALLSLLYYISYRARRRHYLN